MTTATSARLSALILILSACTQSQADSARAGSETPAAVSTIAAAGHESTAFTVGTAAIPGHAAEPVTAVVYKDANCGCCSKWVDHMRAAGFRVEAHDVSDLNAVKRRHGIDRSLHSCHTAEIDGYVVEGHVPADLIQKMLRERPAIAGLAVPGMPVGSPGMEYTYSEPYDVIAFTRSGATSVYAKR